MIEGSGSVSLTNKSGFGSGRGLKTYGSYGSGFGTMEETLLRNGTFQNIPKTRALPIIFQPRVVRGEIQMIPESAYKSSASKN